MAERINNIKRLYNAIFDGVRKPTRGERTIGAPYVKNYEYFWYYFRQLKYIIVAWELCQRRMIKKLSIVRWKLTSPSERSFYPLIPDFWVNAIAKLCDLIASDMGLVFNERTYSYEKPKMVKAKKKCDLKGKVDYDRKFEI